jgi:hypothetical protein
VKKISWFLLKFLLVAALVAPAWYLAIGKVYNQVLVALLDWLQPRDFRCFLEGVRLDLIQLFPDRPPLGRVGLNAFTLHFNAVPFFTLFLITPGVAWKKRLVFLLIAFCLLSVSHIIHAQLDFYVTLNQEVTIEQGNIKSLLGYFGKRFMLYLQAFMEQAGSMLMPFFLWLLFFNKQVFVMAKSQLQQGQVKPVTAAPGASPPSLST